MLLLCALSCGRPAADPASRLLRQLPAGQAVYLYMDLGRIRSSPPLEPFVNKGLVFPDGVAEFAKAADLDPLADIDRAAISMGARGTHLAVEGRFDEGAIRQAIENDGAVCSQSLRSAPCTIPARGSRAELTLSLRAEDLLRVSIGTHMGEAVQFTETALQRLVVEARDRLDQGAMLWATFEPGRAEQELQDPPAGWENLRFFARALQKADRGYFYVDELPDGQMQITLKASCADSSQADSVSKVLTGLNRLAVAALEAGKSEDPPPEVRVLRAARIVNTETTVIAIWVVDEPTLKAWGGVG
jgi:hypothetical protein